MDPNLDANTDSAAATAINPAEAAASHPDSSATATVSDVAEPTTENTDSSAAAAGQVKSLLGDDVGDSGDDSTKEGAPNSGDDGTTNETPSDDDAAQASAEDAKEGDGGQSEEPAPLPTYEDWKIPEDLKVDQSSLSEFTQNLAEFERQTGVDHAKVQEFGQKLVDSYAAEVREIVSNLNDYYQDQWDKQKADWRDAFEADPEIGGNRKDTTLQAAKLAIRTFGGDAAQREEIMTLMNDTGIGNHPALIRLLAKAGESMAEGKPVPATGGKAGGPSSKIQKRYGNTL